jgi:hypothetical protein
MQISKDGHFGRVNSSRDEIFARQITRTSSHARERLASRLFVVQRLAAVAQGQQLRFLQSIAPDSCPVAPPIKRPVPLCHGPEEAIKKVEADTEVAVHEAFAVHATVMNVMQPPGL